MEVPFREIEISAEEEEESLLLHSSNNTRKGGIKTLPFIIANEAVESLGSTGLSPNMTRYLMGEYGMTTAQTSNLLFLWSSANSFNSVLGAFLADSYSGRFPMIAFGTVFNVLGMILLWLTATIPQARPSCDSFTTSSCNSSTTTTMKTTTFQLLLLYSAFGLMSLGSGGIRASSLAFGSDQISNKKTNHLESFISWYYVSTLVGAMIGMTFIVYIQDKLGWSLGFGIPVVLMFLSMLSFFLASPLFVKMKPNASLLTALFRVIVASYRKRNVELSSNERYRHNSGSTLLEPSEKLRFLNKACIITNQEAEEGNYSSNPWSLCTVDQVEDLKSIIRIIPIWLSGIMFTVSFNLQTLPYLMISSMDRHITTNFQVPTGSFTTFLFICLGLWVTLYDRLAVPLATKIRGKPTRMKPTQKMGFGFLLSCLSLATLAIIESWRWAVAIEAGFSDKPRAVVKMSAFWLLPHYVFAAIADASCVIGQNEFYISQLPKSMSSIAAALVGLNMTAGSLVASFIMTVTDHVTGAGGESWVSSNINKGHYDYYFWLICGLSFLNFLYFVTCCKSYGPCNREVDQSSKDED